MHDQADELRQLVRHAVQASAVRAPHWMTVVGGKGGVGATTVALGIARAIAWSGQRVVLVDGDLAGPDLGSYLAIEPRYHLGDVLAARRTVHEALEPGGHGLQLLLGPAPEQRLLDCPATAQERLIEQLRLLGPHADFVVVDAGSTVNRSMRRFWQVADDLLLVTTADPVSVTDTYAALKQLYKREQQQGVHVVVNNCGDPCERNAVGERFAEACRRFLALTLASVAALPPERRLSGLAAGNHSQEEITAAAPWQAWVERWLHDHEQNIAGKPARAGGDWPTASQPPGRAPQYEQTR